MKQVTATFCDYTMSSKKTTCCCDKWCSQNLQYVAEKKKSNQKSFTNVQETGKLST